MEQPAFRSGRITCWPRLPEHIGALRHEVHAAEDDVARIGIRLRSSKADRSRRCNRRSESLHRAGNDGRAGRCSCQAAFGPRQCARPWCGRAGRGSSPASSFASAATRVAGAFSTSSSIVFRLQSGRPGAPNGDVESTFGIAAGSLRRLCLSPSLRGCCNPVTPDACPFRRDSNSTGAGQYLCKTSLIQGVAQRRKPLPAPGAFFPEGPSRRSPESAHRGRHRITAPQ